MNIDVKIIEGYVITSTNGKNNAFNENDIKKMIKEHFQLKEELETVNTEFRKLDKLIREES